MSWSSKSSLPVPHITWPSHVMSHDMCVLLFHYREEHCLEQNQGKTIMSHVCHMTVTSVMCVCVWCRRTLGYEDVLESLARKGIAIRVASPKLVMEEVIILCSTFLHQGRLLIPGTLSGLHSLTNNWLIEQLKTALQFRFVMMCSVRFICWYNQKSLIWLCRFNKKLKWWISPE